MQAVTVHDDTRGHTSWVNSCSDLIQALNGSVRQVLAGALDLAVGMFC